VKVKKKENSLSLAANSPKGPSVYTLPYVTLTVFLNWLIDVNKLSDMTDEKIKSLQKLQDEVAAFTVQLNEILHEDTGTSYTLPIQHKNKLIGLRNFLRLQRDDIETYIEQCRSIYKTRETTSND